MSNPVLKIGIVICNCGGSLNEYIDFEKIKLTFKEFNFYEHSLLCSAGGLEFLKKISQDNIERLVIAGCTPKLHGEKFKKELEENDYNPYLTCIVNIREQCAWVIKNKEEATKRAILMIKASINRVKFQKALYKKELELNPDVLIVGAGLSGLTAAYQLSKDPDRKIFLVEKETFIGGKIVKIDKVFPGFECSSCLFAELMEETMQKSNINLFLNSEVVEAKGNYGNFKVKIKKYTRYINDDCIGCGICIDKCPYNAINFPFPGALPHIPFIDKNKCIRFLGNECEECIKNCPVKCIDFNMKDEEIEIKAGAVIIATGSKIETKDGISLLEMEKLLLENKIPEEVSLIFLNSNDFGEFEVCSSVGLKLAYILLKKNIKLNIFHQNIYINKETELIWKEIREKANVKKIKSLKKIEGIRNSLKVIIGGLKPSDIFPLSKIFEFDINEKGFVKTKHGILHSFLSTRGDIYAVGDCQSLKTMKECISQSLGAVAYIQSDLRPGYKKELKREIANIIEEFCSGCGVCIGVCPFKAIERKNGKVCIEESICEGCGICVVACPSCVIVHRSFTDEQIISEMEVLLRG